MKPSQPPIVPTKLLETFATGAHGDALIGDLVEQYRKGRSAAWYWRQALLAIVVSLAEDRTLGGPAVLGSLLVLLLMVVSVGRHPSSLGTRLFIVDMSLLSGYCAFSAWGWRQRNPAVRDALRVGARIGTVLGLVLVASHMIEWFALDGNRTVQFARGAGSTLLMFGLLCTAGSTARERTNSMKLSMIAGVWCASLGMMTLLGVALTLNLVFEAHSVSWLHGAFVASGMKDPGAFVVRNSLEAGSEILVRLGIAAVSLSCIGSLSNAWMLPRSRSASLLAVAMPFVFVTGIAALWYASSLNRADRPPFVMAGVLAAGLAVGGAHPIWSSLSRRHRELRPGT